MHKSSVIQYLNIDCSVDPIYCHTPNPTERHTKTHHKHQGSSDYKLMVNEDKQGCPSI